jgi:hypothetical protein
VFVADCERLATRRHGFGVWRRRKRVWNGSGYSRRLLELAAGRDRWSSTWLPADYPVRAQHEEDRLHAAVGEGANLRSLGVTRDGRAVEGLLASRGSRDGRSRVEAQGDGGGFRLRFFGRRESCSENHLRPLSWIERGSGARLAPLGFLSFLSACSFRLRVSDFVMRRNQVGRIRKSVLRCNCVATPR